MRTHPTPTPDVQTQLQQVLAVTLQHWQIAPIDTAHPASRKPFRCAKTRGRYDAPPERTLGLTWQWCY